MIVETLNLNEHPHRRYNILSSEWVLVSPHRNKRPWQGKVEKTEQESRPEYDPSCYLCPGNIRSNGQINPTYEDTFVFTNDFSALLPDSSSSTFEKSLLQAKGEKGICRVLCYSPNHALTLPGMSIAQIEKVIQLWQNEYLELGKNPFINHVQIFENKGAVMGCSNPHPHGQIWAQEAIPLEVQKKSSNQKKYFEENGKTLLGDYIDQELRAGERIITENEHFVAVVPFWAVWPFEVMLIPKKATSNIAQLDFNDRNDFANVLQQITQLYDRLFNTSFPYSAGIHQAPTDGKTHPYWHWHFSFYPPLLRSATVKKFMVGYEMFGEPQRDITPESAADRLRSLLK